MDVPRKRKIKDSLAEKPKKKKLAARPQTGGDAKSARPRTGGDLKIKDPTKNPSAKRQEPPS